MFVSRKINQLKLMDFGQSRVVQPGETVRLAYRTPDFIAPEIVTNETVGYGTDIWALGVLLYELIHGTAPFRGSRMD